MDWIGVKIEKSITHSLSLSNVFRELLTCSQDGLVKIWNMESPRTPQRIIETKSPCWRAR
jgi:hypothetical protein